MSALAFVLLSQNGLTNGAIYALLALALVMVFSVTRVILIPQGEAVAYAALTLASAHAGALPGTFWLLCGAGALAGAMEGVAAWRTRGRRGSAGRALLFALGPLALGAAAAGLIKLRLGFWADVGVTILLVAPMGPLLYRIAFRPLADASVLTLLIVAMAVHYVFSGLGLAFFGPEGVRGAPLASGHLKLGGVSLSWQALIVVLLAGGLIALLALFFNRTLLGKALRATAFNPTGARLVGIDPENAGMLAFGLASFIAAISGVLIAPITTIYYDSGFVIGLKGFVAAILGGLASYPLAALGALAIGLMESFSSFWASLFKDVIVFSLLIPILLWRNLRERPLEETEE
jgi:branched-chain amino acid transport system permease protein